MNERKIERTTYEHFSNQLNDFGTIEEQISDNPRISSLLKGASKSGGNGFGRPEHIISFKLYYDLLIITECKGDKKLHESTNSEINPQKYAIDGVKNYSNFLSKEFDVLSIAISGDNIDDCKITHFFQKKGSTGPLEAGFLDLRGPVKQKLLPGSINKDRLAREPRSCLDPYGAPNSL